MFVQSVALEPMPTFAEVDHTTIVDVLQHMTGRQGQLRGALEEGFREMERRQPELANYLSAELATIQNPGAQTLTYFLFLLVYLSFDRAFGSRIGPIGAADIDATLERLITDGELREATFTDMSYSEDMVALGQPALINLIRSEIDRAIDLAPDGHSFKDADPLYEALLVQILVLTHVVAPLN